MVTDRRYGLRPPSAPLLLRANPEQSGDAEQTGPLPPPGSPYIRGRPRRQEPQAGPSGAMAAPAGPEEGDLMNASFRQDPFARIATLIQRSGFFPRSSSRLGLAAAAILGIFFSTWWAAAEPPAGFMEKADATTFPAPYNTEGIRLTNASDCGGGDCVRPIGRSDGRNINDHRGRDAMLVFLGLRDGGPTLFS